MLNQLTFLTNTVNSILFCDSCKNSYGSIIFKKKKQQQLYPFEENKKQHNMTSKFIKTTTISLWKQ